MLTCETKFRANPNTYEISTFSHSSAVPSVPAPFKAYKKQQCIQLQHRNQIHRTMSTDAPSPADSATTEPTESEVLDDTILALQDESTYALKP
jgi:hypothetical protein